MIFQRKKSRLTQTAALREARARGVEVATVLDVGVQRGTGSLIEVYPDVPHVLFEPVNTFFPDIRRHYSRISHEIVEAAVSDVDGTGFMQMGRSGGGSVTHAWLADKGDAVKTVRLDTIAPTLKGRAPYLLKVDVDGADAPARIIDGAQGIMDHVALIICEMVAPRFVDLAAKIERAGFTLWDIVESCYYDDVFYQCDAIFLRRDFVFSHPQMKPFDVEAFDKKKWWESAR